MSIEPKNNGEKKGLKVDLAKVVESVITRGDLRDLTTIERVAYYRRFCQHLDLDPVTQPFDFLEDKGGVQLYANRSCAEQLRVKRRVSVVEETKEFSQGLCIVTVKVADEDGRTDVGTGAVAVEGLKGANLANAIMKAETKAKRRATLSICGLGMMDETEVSDLTGGLWIDRLKEEKRTWDAEAWKEIVFSAISEERAKQVRDFKDFTKDETQKILEKARSRRVKESEGTPVLASAQVAELCPGCKAPIWIEGQGNGDKLPINPETGEIHKCAPDPAQATLL